MRGWSSRHGTDQGSRPGGVINRDTRLVLTNAIYFKGKWKHAFPEAATRSGTFTLSTGKTIGDVPLMASSGPLRYLDGGSFQALELPYGTSEQSMIVFLPRKADGLAELEKTLTAARLTDWLARLKAQEVDVTLPRFKITAEFELHDALRAWVCRSRFPSARPTSRASRRAAPRPLRRHPQGLRRREREGDRGRRGDRRLVGNRPHPAPRRSSVPTTRSSS